MRSRISADASTFSFPSPRTASPSARCKSVTICSGVCAFSTYTFIRESSGAITSNDGFSVVAPINKMFPASTCGRKHPAARD